MNQPTRRDFLKTAAFGLAGAAGALGARSQSRSRLPSGSWTRGEVAPNKRYLLADSVRVLNPRGRVPLSFIIDDSTCLANLAHFCIPQFAEVFPDRYQQDWRSLPREIPDTFVRRFAQWCREHGVKGKYSVIPYPACVGWLDRELPGWSKRELDASLELLRTELAPDWDFHPEMITHTWVIDVRTGRPYPERSDDFMENWGWSQDKSADELTGYMVYALRILENVGIRCEGITTPGGFCSRNRENLARATLEACREVGGVEVPHYFRDLYTDERSVAPRVQVMQDNPPVGQDLGGQGSRRAGDDPRCVVSVVGCTGDWFGGWDGLTPGSTDLFITEDLEGGRLPEVIAREEPAILVCHWPGIYYNGDELGFNIFQEVVRRLDARYDHLLWMKLSEIARYWAARELTAIERDGDAVRFHAPFACSAFTLEISDASERAPRLITEPETPRSTALCQVPSRLHLESGTWHRHRDRLAVCFDLPKGTSELHIA